MNLLASSSEYFLNARAADIFIARKKIKYEWMASSNIFNTHDSLFLLVFSLDVPAERHACSPVNKGNIF